MIKNGKLSVLFFLGSFMIIMLFANNNGVEAKRGIKFLFSYYFVLLFSCYTPVGFNARIL